MIAKRKKNSYVLYGESFEETKKIYVDYIFMSAPIHKKMNLILILHCVMQAVVFKDRTFIMTY